MKAASWGTPDKILRGLEERRALLGDFELEYRLRFGGTPLAVAERGLRLFAKEVLPVLKVLVEPATAYGVISNGVIVLVPRRIAQGRFVLR